MAKYTLEYEAEAECPTCGNDLLCISCDADEFEGSTNDQDLDDLLEIPHTSQLTADIFALYIKCLDEGRLTDMEFTHKLWKFLRKPQ